MKLTVSRRMAKLLTVSRRMAKLLTVSRESPTPLETSSKLQFSHKRKLA